MTVFERDTEQEAYRVLHTQGFDALEDHYPGLAHNLINRWHERGICRVSWTRDSNLKIRTYKKYAGRGA